MERLSNSDFLRAAAEQIEMEDRLSTSDAMFRASEEIVTERGFRSPAKQRPVFSPRVISRNEDAFLSKSAPLSVNGMDEPSSNAKLNQTTPNIMEPTLGPITVAAALESGAEQLMQQMGIPIKPAATSGKIDKLAETAAIDEQQIATDATKLQNELDKKDIARAAARRAMLKSPPRHRYSGAPHSKSVDGLPFDQSRASEYSKSTVHSSLSAVGHALNKLGPRVSANKEALFRAMKVVTVKRESKDSELVRLAQSNVRASVGVRSSQDDAKLVKSKDVITANDARLSRPKSSTSITHNPSKAADRKMRYTLLDEAENCTFKPKLTSGTAESARKKGPREDDEKSSFIVRQEATERGRREDMEFSIGQAAYNALVDKKQCPKCFAKQSYDEVKEKRKQCPNCKIHVCEQVYYCRKITWNKVGRKFFEKTKECAKKAAEEKEKIRNEVQEESKMVEKRVFDKEKWKIVVVVEKIEPLAWNEEIENDFFDRMATKLAEREKKKKTLDAKLINEKYTFKPHISSSSHKINDKLEEDEDPSLEGLSTFDKFLKRVDEDLENRIQTNPQKYAKKKVDEASQVFKV